MPAPKAPAAPNPTLFGALKNVAKGVYHATARFANYAAATATPTTRTSSYTGTNLNSTISQMQRVGMNWTAEDVFKNSALACAYIMQRINYCSSMMVYVPTTGDPSLDRDIKHYLHGEDGCSGVFGTMGVDCSMQDAFSRTADIETPIRGDAGLIIWRDEMGNARLIEWSADQLGEIYNFTLPRVCGLAYDKNGQLYETSGGDCVYLSGRYFRGADCVAYKIYERTNSWYGAPRIYPAHDVIYFRDPASFRGVRGFTKFATAIQHMEKGEALWQIGMDSALRQAKTAMIVMNNRGAPDELSYDTFTGQDGQVTFAERIPAGPMVEYFYTGDDAKFVSPDSPGPELIAGVETSDERVALALGMNYAFLISATKVGGAPSRLEINKAAKELSRIQNSIHRPRLSRISHIAIMQGIRQGILPARANVTRGRWQLPISPTVDAGYSAKENIDNLRAGLETPQDLCAETNRDWETVRMLKKQAAIAVAKDYQDANRELSDAGYEGTITKEDLAQLSDNPQQAANAQAIETNGKTIGDGAPRDVAKLSSFDESKHPRDEDGKWASGNYGETKDRQDILELIDRNSPGEGLNYRALRTAIGSDDYVLKKYKVSDLKFEPGSEHFVDPARARPEKGAIVIGPDGLVIDGRHRSFLAKKKGLEFIDAWVSSRQPAKLAAFIGDILIGDLPEDTRAEIKRILGTNRHTDSLKAIKYGMVASELERMADPHNLESAQRHLRYCTNGSCADEVHASEGKHILVNNGRVVDGHHFLAKALKGKVSKSLPVIDLTPTRFQSAA